MADVTAKIRYMGMSERQQKKYVGRSVAFLSHADGVWRVGIIPPVGNDDISGYFMSDFRQFIILPSVGD